MELNCAVTIIIEWLIVIGWNYSVLSNPKTKRHSQKPVPDCAQNVPVKIKKFQKFTNKTKNTKKSYKQINRLETHNLLNLFIFV